MVGVPKVLSHGFMGYLFHTVEGQIGEATRPGKRKSVSFCNSYHKDVSFMLSFQKRLVFVRFKAHLCRILRSIQLFFLFLKTT